MRGREIVREGERGERERRKKERESFFSCKTHDDKKTLVNEVCGKMVR